MNPFEIFEEPLSALVVDKQISPKKTAEYNGMSTKQSVFWNSVDEGQKQNQEDVFQGHAKFKLKIVCCKTKCRC